MNKFGVAVVCAAIMMVMPNLNAYANSDETQVTPVTTDASSQSEIVFPAPISEVFPDEGLANAVADSLGKQVADTTTAEELATITSFDASDSGISDLEGIQYLTGVTSLKLSCNELTDISPISGLTNLVNLDLSSNQIVDISPLANLTSLEKLILAGNQIEDIGPLASLVNLTFLNVGDNKVTSISSLENLTSLTELYLYSNDISDISPLENLAGLTKLDLSDNSVSDITVLGELTNLTVLKIPRNCITDISPLASLEKLETCNYRGQVIQLEDVEKDVATELVVKSIDGSTSELEITTGSGEYKDGEISWSTEGYNTAEWSVSTSYGEFNGVIGQVVGDPSENSGIIDRPVLFMTICISAVVIVGYLIFRK